ncbi:hypothetical protein PRK78_001864 [Emydomyces testavorans]|uniref:Uncharacterized protein n=1 Tax=Emydomyces testavorans TaxID=2070801 RepID=A0AAF0DEW0_9EURO|nr:hypothetical protein PRK78_001864 [Emydomyces testavorans]
MAYYEPQGWQAPVRQGSWEQPAPPSRSGTSSTAQRDDTAAFASQFDGNVDSLGVTMVGSLYPASVNFTTHVFQHLENQGLDGQK